MQYLFQIFLRKVFQMENWLNLKDKVVIVTGGASGIGYAVVEEFLADGAKVKVLETDAKWCGVTYKEDSEPFKKFISNLKSEGKYPTNLWNK